MWAQKQTDGFTIVELLIVIVVIAILATITIVSYNGIQHKAQRAVVANAVSSLNERIEAHKVLAGKYPGSITDCPSPAVTNLCIAQSSGPTLSYEATPAGSLNGGYIVTLEDSFEVTVGTEKTFVYYSPAVKTSVSREFMQFTDFARFIDKYGLVPYVLSFDIKSDNIALNNKIQVYFQNGSATKYEGLSQTVSVTTDWSHKELTFTPYVSTASQAKAMLAFYGTYDTGNKPSVRNVRLELK